MKARKMLIASAVGWVLAVGIAATPSLGLQVLSQTGEEVSVAATEKKKATKKKNCKSTICHKPGTAAQGTISVACEAVEAHLAHGDTVGACS